MTLDSKKLNALSSFLVVLILAIVITSLISPNVAYNARAVTSFGGGAAAPNVKVIDNVTYCTIGSRAEKLDAYLPNAGNIASSYPVVVFVHGGGWVGGDKSADWNNIFQMLVSNGYIVASINYFLAPSNPPPHGFPLNVEDVACAVRFLRANAGKFHIDANHIGLLGDSAGSNLVALESLSALNGTFDNVGQYTQYSSRVQAVVDEFGPANLTDPAFVKIHLTLLEQVFCAKSNWVKGSPVDYVPGGAPPFLIEQGINDTVVPMSQSVELNATLGAHGDQTRLILVKNAGHEFVHANPKKPIQSSLNQLLNDIVIFFFNSTLK
jgi:acetyl esterase/lipase